MVSIKDIAKKAGVSPSTVSFVLNGKAKDMRISEGITQKVQLAAAEAGYHPNQVAVSLRTGRSKIIALIVETISGSFFSSLARIIEKEAQAADYRVIYCSTGGDIKTGSDVIQMLYQHQVDGYLIIPSAGMEKAILHLQQRQKPFVLLDSYFTQIKADYVLVDNYHGVMQGMTHLLQKGFKKIAFIGNDVKMVQMHERIQAYEDAIKKQRSYPNKKLICKTKYNSPKEDVVKQITNFITRTKPDALFFGANYLGVYGLESIKNLGLTIPNDVAVICFDDLDLFNLYPPGITSIRQPIEAIAETAMQQLLQLITKPRKSNKGMQLKPQLIVRGST